MDQPLYCSLISPLHLLSKCTSRFGKHRAGFTLALQSKGLYQEHHSAPEQNSSFQNTSSLAPFQAEGKQADEGHAHLESRDFLPLLRLSFLTPGVKPEVLPPLQAQCEPYPYTIINNFMLLHTAASYSCHGCQRHVLTYFNSYRKKANVPRAVLWTTSCT